MHRRQCFKAIARLLSSSIWIMETVSHPETTIPEVCSSVFAKRNWEAFDTMASCCALHCRRQSCGCYCRFHDACHDHFPSFHQRVISNSCSHTYPQSLAASFLCCEVAFGHGQILLTKLKIDLNWPKPICGIHDVFFAGLSPVGTKKDC